MKKTIIFTDLDGTLLDEINYSYAQASPALAALASRLTPVILCSSKTRLEIEAYRQSMNNSHPFIAENGGGIFVPNGYFRFSVTAEESFGYQLIALGISYPEIRHQFVRLRNELNIKVRGFADMSISEIASLTGLSEDEASLSRQRDFDEPFVFEDTPDERFLNAIEAAGLRWTQGRLFHIMGKHDKGHAVNLLTELYRRQLGDITTVALGDSLNDLPMLRAVDKAVLVRHLDGSYDQRINIPNLLKTRLHGPAGWNEAVLQLFEPKLSNMESLPADRENLLSIFNAALKAVDPYNAVLQAAQILHGQLHLSGILYNLDQFDRIIVVGAGKATARMALAVESRLGNKITEGLIVIKDGHTAPLSIVKQVEAAHPVPNAAGIAGAQSILQLLRAADEKTLVICLLSGGASALLVAPAEGLTLQDKQQTTELLLNAGASINELNAVRKHLSKVKGGRLAQAAYPAQMLTLILSDVIGDPLDVIASGPTAQDSSTYTEAWAVIAKYGLGERLPQRVTDYLQRGIAGLIAETVKENAPCLGQTHNVIIAGLHHALAAAEEEAVRLGYSYKIISEALDGEARDGASFLAKAARDEQSGMSKDEKRCLLCGGETTVTVRGFGKGGRNQEFALAFALEIEGAQGISLLSAGTDGGDGPTDAAGAIVDGSTAACSRDMGIDPLSHLDHNDAYNFFQRLDSLTRGCSHLKTGPTGTNVMDIQIVLLRSDIAIE